MPYEFKLPDLGEGLTEGEVARWLVAEGDEIAEDQPLVEIQTDKTTVEIPSPAAGRVTSIRAAEGDVVPVGTVLVVIGGDAAQTAVPQPAASAPAMARGQTPDLSERDPAAGRVQATPLVRRIAAELGVPLESVAATGPGGRITEDDVRRAAGPSQPPTEGRREKVRGVRRQIVEHLARAHREVPAVTYVEECDFSNVDVAQLLPTVLRTTALSLQEFPELNARLEEDEIVYLDRYDLGIAVQTEQGLVVPVVRGCAERSLASSQRIERHQLRAQRHGYDARSGLAAVAALEPAGEPAAECRLRRGGGHRSEESGWSPQVHRRAAQR